MRIAAIECPSVIPKGDFMQTASPPDTIVLSTLLRRALGVMYSGPDVHVNDVCSDSRKVVRGALFVALHGTKTDGSRFIADALARGAVAVVCESESESPAGANVIRVPDARTALARLAAVYFGLERLQTEGQLTAVGLTGTNGKSTTAYLVRSVITAARHRAALLGTIEYDLVGRKLSADLTTPDCVTLTRHLVEAHGHGARHAVMEVSSHSLDQRRCDGVRFSAAVFTNLTQDHLDYHETLENYLAAKRRLFDSLDADAWAIVNADDPACDRMVERTHARVLKYGLSVGADMRAEILEESIGGTKLSLRRANAPAIELHTPLIGRHNVYNVLAAAGVGIALGLTEREIARGIADMRHVPGRLQRIDTAGLGYEIFVDYAHTDDALRNVLGAARPLTTGKLWCVFGCGGDRDRTKRPKMARAVAECADRFVVTSDNPRTEDPAAIIRDIEAGLSPDDRPRGMTEPDRAKAIAAAISKLAPGDTLIIAGKGHEDYQIIGTTKTHFDDVEVASRAVASRMGQSA